MKKGGIHYVYLHRDPITRECLYVGSGTRGRAWTMVCSNKDHPTRYGHRTKEHAEHLETLTEVGFVASDWVQILVKGKTKEEAHEIERRIIEDRKPRFNLKQGLANLKITKETMEEMKKLRAIPRSYSTIAKQVGLSTMTVWRALNGRTKNAPTTH